MNGITGTLAELLFGSFALPAPAAPPRPAPPERFAFLSLRPPAERSHLRAERLAIAGAITLATRI